MVYRSRGRYTRHDTKCESWSVRRNSSARRREPRSTTALAMSSSCRALSEKSSERGIVWMMSSVSCPGWLLSPCDSASASWTRREISGISSTFAFEAATVNNPTNRCSIGGVLAGQGLADHHDVRVRAVAQVARHGRLRQHQQVVLLR